MKFFEIRRELEIEKDINNLTAEELIDKYGQDVRKSISLLSEMASLLKRNAFYQFCEQELLEKMEHVAIGIKEGLEAPFVNARANIVLKNVEECMMFEKEEGYLENILLGYNFNLGINALNCPLWTYEAIINSMSKAANNLERLGKVNDEMPDPKTAKRIISKALKDYKNVKYIKLKGDGDKIDALYSEYPLMNLCFNKDFLVLVNYLIQKPNFDKEDKAELIELTKKVITISNIIEPVERITGEVDMDEYRRLAFFTARNIAKQDSNEKTSIAAKIKKKIFN